MLASSVRRVAFSPDPFFFKFWRRYFPFQWLRYVSCVWLARHYRTISVVRNVSKDPTAHRRQLVQLKLLLLLWLVHQTLHYLVGWTISPLAHSLPLSYKALLHCAKQWKHRKILISNLEAKSCSSFPHSKLSRALWSYFKLIPHRQTDRRGLPVWKVSRDVCRLWWNTYEYSPGAVSFFLAEKINNTDIYIHAYIHTCVQSWLGGIGLVKGDDFEGGNLLRRDKANWLSTLLLLLRRHTKLSRRWKRKEKNSWG